MGTPSRVSATTTGRIGAICLPLVVGILLAGLFAPIARAETVGAVEHFPTKCAVEKLVAGPDGDVWFSCVRIVGNGEKWLLGRIIPAGAVTEFGAGIPAGTAIRGLVAGPDGNLWFTLDGTAPRTGGVARAAAAIGRITPEGQVTLFTAGLREGSAPAQIVAGTDGAVWFVDGTRNTAGPPPEIGRVTPDGAIAEFPLGLPKALTVGGIVAGAEGSIWFTQVFDLPHGDDEPGGPIGRVTAEGTVTSFGSPAGAMGGPILGPDGNVWFFESPGGPVSIGRVTPSGETMQFGRKKLGAPYALAAGPDGNVWFTSGQSIGRVTPAGQISRFTDCMDFRKAFSAARSIVPGPDGNLWFTTDTSGFGPTVGEAGTLGRVTPSGDITLFKDGVGGARSLIAGPDGGMWFAEGGDEVERITPPSAPVNTFIFAPGRARKRGAAEVAVELPGPGTIELRRLALRQRGGKTTPVAGATVRAVAPACGPTRLKLRLTGAAASRLYRTGRAQLEATATFTPTGGSANTETQSIDLSGPRHPRKNIRPHP
jgi:streptogramin lyase